MENVSRATFRLTSHTKGDSPLSVETLLSENLEPLGFKKNRKTWLRQGADFSTALVLLRSRYGGRSYIDVELRFDESSAQPDVMTRLGEWANDERDLQEILVDDNPKLEEEFELYLRERIVPLLSKLSVEYLRTANGHYLLEGALLNDRAAEAFDF